MSTTHICALEQKASKIHCRISQRKEIRGTTSSLWKEMDGIRETAQK
jgi:hypothetical protein